MRDRLIELLKEAHESWLRYVDECAFNQTALSFSFEQMFADHLLAEGIIVPPCKVGDRIYYIDSTNFIDCEVVKQVSINHHGEWLVLLDHSCIGFDEIGKTIFLTQSEAEKALAERSADDDT